MVIILNLCFDEFLVGSSRNHYIEFSKFFDSLFTIASHHLPQQRIFNAQAGAQ